MYAAAHLRSKTVIRKQLYIADDQQRKLRALVAHWRCTESEVVRKALDSLPDPEASIDERLAAAGLLVAPPPDADLPSLEEVAALEAELAAWLSTRIEPLHLAEAVIENRH